MADDTGGYRPEAPHSRACGPRRHDHGPDCHPNCPTCGGKNGSPDLTDHEMRLAHLTPAIEVECKACDVLVGVERDRGRAWALFSQHVEEAHRG